MNQATSSHNMFARGINNYINFIAGSADYGGMTSKQKFIDTLGVNTIVLMLIPLVISLITGSAYIAAMGLVVYETFSGASRFALAMRRFNDSSHSLKRYLAKYILEAFAPSLETALIALIAICNVVSFVLWLTAI